MVKDRNSQNQTNNHFVDIHEVVPEEEEEEDEEQENKQANHRTNNNNNNKTVEKPPEKQRLNNRPPVMKFREGKRNTSFSRQVSLETGVSKLNKAQNNEMTSLPRSGRSFGGFGSSHGVETNVKKGDFNLFRTKSTLGKQNSFMLPLRKESGFDQFQKNGNGEEGVGLLDETVNKSVPAGRYFAALTGPELDQVKVFYHCNSLISLIINLWILPTALL